MNPRRLPNEPRPGGDTSQAYFVLGITIGLLAAVVIDRAARLFFDRDMELVREVRDMAGEEFVREVDDAKLIDDALGGMLSGLDEYSHYYGPAEVAALERETSGEFLGIGVVFRAGEPGRVLFPYPGSPAEEAGLRVGDLLVRVGGEPIEGMETGRLQELLHSDDGAVPLEVRGLDGTVRELAVHPQVVLDPTVRHARMQDPEAGIGYLAIHSFSHRTPGEFDRAIEGLRAHGLRSLVLDLRVNPGGILDSAVTIANRFIAMGAIVATRSRDETRVTRAEADRATLAGMPLVVLLDGSSASASEVLAAALQDHAVAVLVGEPSYGKGTVQTLRHIGRDRAVVKLTTANYCSPSLRRIEHEDGDAVHSGIAPDLWLPLTPSERDAVHRFLHGYSPPDSARAQLAEWEESEGIHLIDAPPSDRQLESAVALLSGKAPELRGDPLQ